MNDEIKIVSPDDHVVEPAGVWVTRLPRRSREVGPRVMRTRGHITALGGEAFQEDEDGLPADLWLYEDRKVATTRQGAAAGFPIDDLSNDPVTYDTMRPGCYEPKARLEDMDLAGIEAQVCLPNSFVRFCGQRFLWSKDKDLAKLCVEAYNDWMVDEWCGDSGGRLIPLGIIPLWDARLAADEVARMAGRGMHAMCFSELPARLGLPSIHSGEWDPFFAACEVNGTVIMMHIGSSSTVPKTSDDAPHVITSSLMATHSAMSMMDWLFSAVLCRFPRLKIGFGECQAGWIPYFLQRADEVWETRRAWGGVHPLLKDPPSTQVPGRVFYSFFDDDVALRNLDVLGADNIMFETDYPHGDTNWPDSLHVANKATEHLDLATKEKVLRTNARTLFGLD